MAVVGSAYIVVNAITTGFQNQVQQAMNGMGNLGQQAGSSLGSAFSSGATSSMSAFAAESIATYQGINALIEKSYFLQGAIGALIPVLGSAAAGITALGLEALSAGPALAALGGIMAGLLQGMVAFKLAFGGVGKAIGQLTKPGGAGGVDKMPALLRAQEDAQHSLERSLKSLEKAQKNVNEAYETARERIQQLNFDTEDAAIGEKRAAIELEKARETLARVQDLAPNTRARREAELAFAQADLNLRKQKDRLQDLQKEQAKNTANNTLTAEQAAYTSREYLDAKDAEAEANYQAAKAQDNLTLATKRLKDELNGVGGAGQNALAGLNEYQIEFAKFIAGLKPKLNELKLAISENLFPPLQEAIQLLVDKLFPTLKQKLAEAGAAIGKSAKDFAGLITTDQAVKDLGKNMDTNNYVLSNFGIILGNITRLIQILLVAADPLIRRFTDWIRELTGDWASKAGSNVGGLTDMFNKAGDIAAGFGKIIGNIIGAFKNMAQAVTGPGGGGTNMLQWFIDLSQRFEDFTKKHLQSGRLEEYFAKASKGFMGILGILGNIVKGILEFADSDAMPGIVENIGKGVDALIKALPNFVAVGVKFAEFVGLLLEHIAQFAESGSVNNFFTVVNGFAKGILAILSNPIAEKIFIILAAMHGLRLGVGRVSKSLETFGKYIAGDYFNFKNLVSGAQTFGTGVKSVSDSIVLMSGNVPILGNGLMGLTTMFEGLGLGAASSAAAVGVFLVAIAAIIAVFVLAYKYSETFRESISNLVEAVGGALKAGFDRINEAIAIAMPQFGSLSGIFKAIGDFLGTYLVPILQYVLVGAINTVVDVIVFFIKIIGGVIDIFKALMDYLKIFWRLFHGDFKGAGEAFQSMWSNIVSGVKKIFGGLAELLKNVFKGAINFIIDAWNAIEFKVPGFKLGPLKFDGFVLGLPDVPRLADGGIVQPSYGGTLARVAEAGRAERIEPLDPDGLSKRDKAMIKMLSGGAGGVTINVHPAPGMDERELASLVSRQLAVQLSRGMA